MAFSTLKDGRCTSFDPNVMSALKSWMVSKLLSKYWMKGQTTMSNIAHGEWLGVIAVDGVAGRCRRTAIVYTYSIFTDGYLEHVPYRLRGGCIPSGM